MQNLLVTGGAGFIGTNIVGTHSLLKAAKKIRLGKKTIKHRFHHISTDEVYGSLKPDDPPFSETTPYAASKASSDHLARAYHKTYGLEVTTSNCSNNYGQYQFPEKLIPLIILNILQGRPLPVYGDENQIRNWLYVDDHNLGIDLILHKGTPGETYNIGGNEKKANIKIVTRICQLIDEIFKKQKELNQIFPNSPASKGNKSESLITHVEDRAGHDRRYAIDALKISSDLSFLPKESFKTGIL